MKSINIVVVVAGILMIAAFALISMPQMIVSANAQSERASERACPVPGYTLSKGECTTEPALKDECKPFGGVTPVPSGSTCRVTVLETMRDECEKIGGLFEIIFGKKPPQGTCEYTATETITCPGGVFPTEEGECITKPGRGNDPRT